MSVRGEALLNRGDLAGARVALTEAVTLAPDVADWLLILAGLDDQAGDVTAAITRYERVLRMQPNQVVALNNLAYALATHKKAPADALPLARRAVALAPANATIIDTLAFVEHLLGNNGEASKLLAEAIRLDPALVDARVHAAQVFIATAAYERAEAELNEALRLDPNRAKDVQELRDRLATARTQAK
jgi:Tfp pilus assembly protein PilF